MAPRGGRKCVYEEHYENDIADPDIAGDLLCAHVAQSDVYHALSTKKNQLLPDKPYTSHIRSVDKDPIGRLYSQLTYKH